MDQIEEQLKCGGWCDRDDLYQMYSFSNINRGPPLKHTGCYIQLIGQYKSAGHKFIFIGAIVAFLTLFNIIITGLNYKQQKHDKEKNFKRKISVFDDAVRKRM